MNRSRDHHFKKQDGLCNDCKKHVMIDDNSVQLHHIFTKEGGATRPKKGMRVLLCNACHAKRHDFKYGWMRKYKK